MPQFKHSLSYSQIKNLSSSSWIFIKFRGTSLCTPDQLPSATALWKTLISRQRMCPSSVVLPARRLVLLREGPCTSGNSRKHSLGLDLSCYSFSLPCCQPWSPWLRNCCWLLMLLLTRPSLRNLILTTRFPVWACLDALWTLFILGFGNLSLPLSIQFWAVLLLTLGLLPKINHTYHHRKNWDRIEDRSLWCICLHSPLVPSTVLCLGRSLAKICWWNK